MEEVRVISSLSGDLRRPGCRLHCGRVRGYWICQSFESRSLSRSKVSRARAPAPHAPHQEKNHEHYREVARRHAPDRGSVARRAEKRRARRRTVALPSILNTYGPRADAFPKPRRSICGGFLRRRWRGRRSTRSRTGSRECGGGFSLGRGERRRYRLTRIESADSYRELRCSESGRFVSFDGRAGAGRRDRRRIWRDRS